MIFLNEWIAIVAKRFIWSSLDERLYVLPTMIIKWLHKSDLDEVLGGPWVTAQLRTLLEVHDKVDWSRVPYGQRHHYDRTDRANASLGRPEDAGGQGSGNWIPFDRTESRSLQPELMQDGTEPGTTVNAERPSSEGNPGSGGRQGVSLPAKAVAVGGGPAELQPSEAMAPGEASIARRRFSPSWASQRTSYLNGQTKPTLWRELNALRPFYTWTGHGAYCRIRQGFPILPVHT